MKQNLMSGGPPPKPLAVCDEEDESKRSSKDVVLSMDDYDNDVHKEPRPLSVTIPTAPSQGASPIDLQMVAALMQDEEEIIPYASSRYTVEPLTDLSRSSNRSVLVHLVETEYGEYMRIYLHQ